MLLICVLLWMCIRLGAPEWCYLMLWVTAAIKVLDFSIDMADIWKRF